MKRKYWQIVMGVVSAFVLVVLFTTGNHAYAAKSSFEQAVEAWDKKDYERSAILSQKAIQEDPKSGAAKKLLGWNYIKLSRVAEAEALFLEAKKIKKDDIGAVQGLAWAYGEQGMSQDAEKAFKEEIAWAKKLLDADFWMDLSYDDQSYIQSIYSDGHYGLGQLAQRAGSYKQAADFLNVSLKNKNQFTPEGERYMTLGDIYYADGNLDKAGSAYESVLKQDKKNLQAQLKLAWTLYYAKKYPAAQKAFEKAYALNKYLVEGVYGLALSQYMDGKMEPARTNLAAAIKIYPYYVDNAFIHGIIEKKPEWRTLWKDFGMAYYGLGYYAAAVYKLDGYLGKVKADDYDAIVAAAWSYRWLGYLDKAKATFETAAKMNPKADEPLVGLGSTLMGYGNKNSESLAAFNQAVTVNPNSAIAYNGMAYLYVYQKDDKKAEEALKKSLAIYKDYYDSQFFLANLLFKQKRYDEAAGEYEKVIKINKFIVTAWNNAGWCYYYDGKYDKAIKAFNESKLVNPYLVEPYYALGLAYAKKGDMDMAKAQIKTAIEIYPYYAHSAELVKLIKTTPGWGDLYSSLGWSYYYNQQYGLALAAFKEYLAVKPNDLTTRRGIAWSNYWVSFKDAYASFQDILKTDGDDVDAMVGLGWVLFFQNKDKEALGYLQKAVKKEPKLTNAWRTIAAIQFRSNNIAEAEAIYKKVAEMEPKALDVRNNQGWALYKEQKYKEAMDKFNDSLRLNRYFGEPHYGLALCYLKTGDTEKAKTSFTTAINLYPAYMDGKELYGMIEGNKALNSLYNTLGWSYYNKYYFAAAKFHFNRMVKLDPKNQEAAQGLAAVAKVLGPSK